MPSVVRSCAEQLAGLRRAGYVDAYDLPDPLRSGWWRVRLRGSARDLHLRTPELRLLLIGLLVGACGRLPVDPAVPDASRATRQG